MNIDFNRLYLTFDGRIARREFWIGLLGIAVAMIVLLILISLIFGPLSFVARLLLFICQVAIAYPCYAVFAKRFQDRGRPGIYAAAPIGVFLVIALASLFNLTGTELAPNMLGTILGFIDLVVGLWILIDLGIMPGTPGPNEFGPQPAGVM